MPRRPSGRPTPQPETRSTQGPRFRDVPPEAFKHPDANPYLIAHRHHGPTLIPADQAWTYKDRWAEVFGRSAPLHVEIGSGNGFFLAGFAARHPEINLIGVEIRYKRTVLCARKIDEAQLSNARILRYHAAYLDDLFSEGSVAALHINHPDPWPKERHEKNRLISRWFLTDAAQLLADEGVLRLKSDHLPNIERLEQALSHDAEGRPAEPLPFDVLTPCTDVHDGPFAWADGEPDLETNYQSKFRKRGEPVYVIEIRRRPR